ncbi:glycosyltransferase [Croceicoccus sp. Ery5]|uniref:glycosyltransferase n=1 Tax=Croceicoccus sp. Ery5 TaxID=1703340 RepID=UPI001E3E92EB|nr:glycosyltransferase [Croceicoccus sp. Ery5]
MALRLAFVINSIGSGGAERVLDILLRNRPDWAADFEIHLIILDEEPKMRAMGEVDKVHVLDGRGSLLRSTRQLHRLLDEIAPDLVVSFLIRASLTAASWRWRKGSAPVVVCERMHTSSHIAGRYGAIKSLALRVAIRFSYGWADRVLAVSRGVAADLAENFAVPKDRIAIVPNPYDPNAIAEAAKAEPAVDLPSSYIVAVGRLVAAKDFAVLIEAFADARPQLKGLQLVILGDGPERDALTVQIHRSGLEGMVHLPGYLANPLSAMARGQFLVSASRNEGFPNVIAEAMALSLPVIATDCPSGPAELLQGNAGAPGTVVKARAGLVVPMGDRRAMSLAMGMLAMDMELAAELAQAGRRRIGDFPQEEVVAQYWSVFGEYLGRAG